MPRVSFRPHTLSLLSVGEGHYDDATGDFVPASEEWSDKVPCRFEPNGKARTVPVGEDKDYVYDYTVYLNVDCPEIGHGQMVRLFNAQDECIGEFRARGFHRCQLDSKLWV